MAVTVDISNTMTTLWNADSDPGFSGGYSTFSGFQREGSACLGIQVSNTTIQDYISVTSFNGLNEKIYMWMKPLGQMDTLANGGVGIVVGDGTNIIAYYLGGSNYTPAFNIYGWACYVLDLNNKPTGFAAISGSEASLNEAAITQVGFRFKTLAKSLGGAENCFLDIARRGTGLEIKGGTSGDPAIWAEVAADDASIASGKAYGIVMEFQPGVYGVQGDIYIGDQTGTTSTYFKDANATVVFMDTGALAYTFSVVGNSTGTNEFIDGIVVGSGDTRTGRSGSTYLNAGPQVTVDLNDTNVDTLELYGTKFQLIDQGVFFGADTSHVVAGVIFQQCGQVDLGQVVARNLSFAETTATDAALLWNESINIKNSRFTANTTGAGIEHPSSVGTPYSYDNLQFSGNTFDVNNTSGSAIVISLLNTPTGAPTTYTGSSVTFSASVTVTITGLADNTEVTVVQRGTPEDTGTDGESTVGSRNFVTGNTWTPDQFKGRILEITSGADIGRYYVSGNSATTLYLDQQLSATATGLSYEIYDENDDTIDFHLENSSGNVSYAYSSGAGTKVDILAFHVDYNDYVLAGYTKPSTNQTLPISQIPDNIYYNP
jgi:hypothetical protein